MDSAWAFIDSAIQRNWTGIDLLQRMVGSLHSILVMLGQSPPRSPLCSSKGYQRERERLLLAADVRVGRKRRWRESVTWRSTGSA
jgi:hypothetical protein